LRTDSIHPALRFFQKYKIKGFLSDEEGLALYNSTRDVAHIGPCLEVGSYCGRSSVFLGLGCQSKNTTLYAVDHHRGSEEHQPGELYHDAELFDHELQCMDSFPVFRRTLQLAKLEDTVVPIVAPSKLVARDWQTPLSLVFIDGGHSPSMSMEDCRVWSEKIAVGGLLMIHDIFEDERAGGQGPYQAMQAVLNNGRFAWEEKIQSLGVLRRLPEG